MAFIDLRGVSAWTLVRRTLTDFVDDELPTYASALAFQLFFFAALLARMKAELLSARLRTLLFNRLRAQGAAGAAQDPTTGAATRAG